MKRQTIKDVAELAGVSIATVSLVLKGGQPDRYTPKTAKRVLRAAAKLKYQPNRIARNLQRSQSRTLGFVTHKDYELLTRSQWYSALLDGVLSVAVERDYDVKLAPLATDNETPGRKLEDGSIDGVILAAPAEDSPLLRWAGEKSLPCVIAGRLRSDDTTPAVGIDDFAAEFAATQYLISKGHRRIALLGSTWIQWSARQRELGYEAAMREAGLDAPAELRFRGIYTESSGEELMHRILHLNPRPTAIVCASDDMAVGALRVMQQANVRVPEDISIIGFDDQPKASMALPPLSSVRQRVSEIGRTAAQLLLDLIEGRRPASRHVVLPTELVLRGSTATDSKTQAS